MATSKTIVLITGANIGVGKATSKVLVESSPDYHVIMGSRSIEKGQTAMADIKAGDIKGSISLVQLDVNSEESIAAAAEAVDKEFDRIDVLINNAGVGAIEQQTLREKMDVTFEANARGAVLVTEAFKPLLLRSSRARLIFVSSVLGSITMKLDPNSLASKADYLPYRMSKAAMNMAAAHYHMELQDRGVKMHVMCPGFVATNLRRDAVPLPNALDPETSGQTLRKIIEGGRDAEVGKFVHNTGSEGQYTW